jgi:ferredoxin-thioredoxin reductase catalytic chain
MTTSSTEQSNKDKILESMKNFAEQYAKRTDTYFCVDPSVTAVVIEGLAKHKEELGAPLCPCRHYEDKEAEVKNTFWNCPCVPMRERKDCHCMLFIDPANENVGQFAGERQDIEIEEIEKVRDSMK